MAAFDFTNAMTRLCMDVTQRVPALAHVDMQRILVTATVTRKRGKYGVYADITPLRFSGGGLVGPVKGRPMRMPRIVDAAGREQLYIVTFFLPRFLEAGPRERLEVVTHELWHVSPDCDGTLRRFAGTDRVHGPTQLEYDLQVARLAEEYLAARPAAECLRFLRTSWGAIRREFQRMSIQRIGRPRLSPLQ